MTWPERIKQARIQLAGDDGLPISRDVLAYLLGRASITVAGWERGQHEPHGRERERIIMKLTELGVKHE